jgi:hypothetical protein
MHVGLGIGIGLAIDDAEIEYEWGIEAEVETARKRAFGEYLDEHSHEDAHVADYNVHGMLAGAGERLAYVSTLSSASSAPELCGLSSHRSIGTGTGLRFAEDAQYGMLSKRSCGSLNNASM